MILYLTFVSIALACFWLYYRLLLQRSTFFEVNRWFLFGGLLFSFLVPHSYTLIKATDIIQPEAAINEFSYINHTIDKVESIGQELNNITKMAAAHHNWMITLYWTVSGLLLLRLIYGTYRFILFSRNSSAITVAGQKVFQHEVIKQPFSLFNRIYLPKAWTNKIPNAILIHEAEHINKFHFVDTLLTEIACIILWFNPLIYLYRNSVRLNLEYLADRGVVSEGEDPVHYQSLLLSSALDKKTLSPLTINLTTPLKNRIQMMNKRKSSNWNSLALLGIFPLLIGLTALNKQENIRFNVQKAISPLMVPSESETIPAGFPIKPQDRIRLASGYGERIHPITKERVFHTGIDIMAKSGTPIYATGDGSVELAQYDDKKGYFVKISHSEKYQTQYNHLKSFAVFKGSLIKKGQLIGYVGSSGRSFTPHVHYEVHEDGKAVDPKRFIGNC